MGIGDRGVPEICYSFLIRCAKQHRVSATVMMRARWGLGGRHPLLIVSESAQTFEHTFAISLAKHCIQHFFFFLFFLKDIFHWSSTFILDLTGLINIFNCSLERKSKGREKECVLDQLHVGRNMGWTCWLCIPLLCSLLPTLWISYRSVNHQQLSPCQS